MRGGGEPARCRQFPTCPPSFSFLPSLTHASITALSFIFFSFALDPAPRGIHVQARPVPLLLTNQTPLPSYQLGFPSLPAQPPTAEELAADEKTLQDLHHLLMETQMMEGKLVCGNCGHEYAVREGIANFLLPSHLV